MKHWHKLPRKAVLVPSLLTWCPVTGEIQTQCINTIKNKIRELYVHEIVIVNCNVNFGEHHRSAEHHDEIVRLGFSVKK